MLVYFGSFTGEILNLENQATVKNTKYYILAKKGVPQRNTTSQKKDIYLAYIDFRIVFGFIDHTRLLAMMEDLG